MPNAVTVRVEAVLHAETVSFVSSMYGPSSLGYVQKPAFKQSVLCRLRTVIRLSPNIVRVIKSKRMRWAGHVARMGEERGCIVSFWGRKPEGKRPLGRPRRRCVDNIRMDLQEAGCGYMDWIGLAQDRDRWRTIVSAVMNLRVP